MKRIRLVIAFLCVALGMCVLAACGGEKKTADDGKLKVTFVDGNSTISTVKVEKGGKVSKPEQDPTKTGYDFVDWFATPSFGIPYDFDAAVNKNISVYAGFRSQAADDHTWFLVGESGSTTLFKEVGWKDVSQGVDPDNLPEKIVFVRDDTQLNKFTLTADFYAGDKFQIINTESGWSGQLGYGYLEPKLQSTETDAPMVSGGGLGDGAKKANTLIGKSGNYTITLYVDKDNKLTQFTYVRNGDPTPLPVEFNYFIKGEKITGWADMYVPYTMFAADDDFVVYTLTIGMVAGDQFMFMSQQRIETDITAPVNATAMPLATDEKTAEALELSGNNYKIKAGAGTYEFTITETGEGADVMRTLSAQKKSETAPAYDFYLKGSFNNDATWSERTAMEYNETTKMYEKELDLAVGDQFMVTVCEAGDDDKTEVFGVGIAYANTALMSESIEAAGNNFKAKEAEKFLIKIDPVSMRVIVSGENDIITYVVYIHGSFNGAGWADGGSCEIVANGDELSGKITKTLAANDTFGFRVFNKTDVNKSAQIAWANADSTGWTGCEGLSGSGNVTCDDAGDYEFIVVIDEDGKFVSVTAQKKAA